MRSLVTCEKSNQLSKLKLHKQYYKYWRAHRQRCSLCGKTFRGLLAKFSAQAASPAQPALGPQVVARFGTNAELAAAVQMMTHSAQWSQTLMMLKYLNNSSDVFINFFY